MVPVTISTFAVGDGELADLNDALNREFGALGLMGRRISVVKTPEDSPNPTVTITGLLGLDNVPIEERTNRARITARAALSDAGFESDVTIDVTAGWDQLRSTEILLTDLQRALDATLDDALAYVDQPTPSNAEMASSIRQQHSTRPTVADEYDISLPMFNRLVRQRRKERESGTQIVNSS